MLNPSHMPPPLAHSGVAYDIGSNRAVLFGGITGDTWSDQTWVWNGEDWSNEHPANSPSTREKLAMAYDEGRDSVVLFGGVMGVELFDDTWEWNGSDWRRVESEHKPPARCCHAMAYDSAQNRVMLFGGWSPVTGEFFNDTWEWDGIDWVEVSCCHVPLTAAHTLVSLRDEAQVVAVPSTEGVNTWIWDGSIWTEVKDHPSPSRADGRSAYFSTRNEVVFFGGARDNALLNDTWVFDGRTWRQLDLPELPSQRYAHAMFFDAKRNSMIVFGGAGSSGLLQDTWEFVLAEVPGQRFTTTSLP